MGYMWILFEYAICPKPYSIYLRGTKGITSKMTRIVVALVVVGGNSRSNTNAVNVRCLPHTYSMLGTPGCIAIALRERERE